MRSLKWLRWSCGSDFPSYAFMAGSLNHSNNLASRIFRLKGDPVATVINSTSFSFMIAIVRWRSSIRISPCLLGATSGCLLCEVDCWDRSWSRLLFSVSLKSAPWPNLLKMLPELLLSPFWSRRTLPVCPLAPTEAGMQKRATLALKLAPIRWIVTTIGFSPFCYVHSALEFSPIHCPLGPLGFHPSVVKGYTLPTRRLIPPRTYWSQALRRIIGSPTCLPASVWRISGLSPSWWPRSSLWLLQGLRVYALC